jgi:hypothetical protein
LLVDPGNALALAMRRMDMSFYLKGFFSCSGIFLYFGKKSRVRVPNQMVEPSHILFFIKDAAIANERFNVPKDITF